MFSPLSLSTALSSVRRNLVWWLVAAYALAVVWPVPGDHLRRLELGELPFSGGGLNPTHLLLAILLFCVGLSMRSEEARNLWRLTRAVVWGVAGSWLVPLAGLGVIAVASSVCLNPTERLVLLSGAVLVMAMPPANSSSVWSELSGGRTAATVTVIILGTALSPVITPLLLGASMQTLGQSAWPDAGMAASLEVLVAFVVLPAGLGIVVRSLLESFGSRALEQVLSGSRFASLSSLLLLNYANAAAAVPQLLADGITQPAVTVAVWSVLLCMAVFAVGLIAGRGLASDDVSERLAFVYVTGMKNTGAALVLATTLLDGRPLAVLVPVFYTLAQHLAAALIDRWVASPIRNSADARLGQATTPSY